MDTDAVYKAIGSWLNDYHNSTVDDTADAYCHSCALRLSIALAKSGNNLQGVPGAVHIDFEGHSHESVKIES